MIRQQLPLLAILFSLLSFSISAEDEKYLKAFPEAQEGMVRYVVQLPHKERGEDDDYRVEIFVGKVMLTDGVNGTGVSGKIEAKPLKGWGFTYYEVAKFGPVVSTLIGVPPGTPKVEKFVAMPSMMIRYNSRIPLVVYVPEGGELRYRIWSASDITEIADKG